MSPAVAPTRNATEEAIVEAVKGAVAELGVDGLTMAAIARRAHVSRTALYFYFPNTHAVLDRAVVGVFADLEAAAAPYLDAEGDPRRDLHATMRRVAGVIAREGRVFLVAAQHAGARGEHMPGEWAPHLRRLRARAAARLQADRVRGLAPADLPAEDLVRMLLEVVQQHIVRALVAGEPVRPEVLAEVWWRTTYAHPDAVLAGMRAGARKAAGA